LGSWTIGTKNFDGIKLRSFSTATGTWSASVKQLAAEVTRLNGKRILVGECGHASRAAHDFVPGVRGKDIHPGNEFMGVTAGLLRKGKNYPSIPISSRNGYLPRSLHIARSGWIVEQREKSSAPS